MSDRRYEIINEPGHRPVKAWTRGAGFDAKARQQVLDVASAPFVHGWVALNCVKG